MEAVGSEKNLKDGSVLSPVVAYLELSPCKCTNHDSQVMDTLQVVEVKECEGDDEQNWGSSSSGF